MKTIERNLESIATKSFLNYLLNKKLFLRIIMYFLNDTKKEQIYIARYKSKMLSYGYNASKLTDKEIIECFSKFGELIDYCGYTTKQISDAMCIIAEHPSKENFSFKK